MPQTNENPQSDEMAALTAGLGDLKNRLTKTADALGAEIENIQQEREHLERTVVKSVPIDRPLNGMRATLNELRGHIAELPDAPETPEDGEESAPASGETFAVNAAVAPNVTPGGVTAPAAAPSSTPVPIKAPSAPVAPASKAPAESTPSGDNVGKPSSPVDPRGGGRSG